eukprot:935512-Heterocapsa_arctica.AAC.1
MAVQGLTRKEARTRETPEGNYTNTEGTLDEDWIRWNKASENYLGQVEDKLGQEFKGRGQTLTYVKNTISAPQDNSEGFAITAGTRKQKLTLNRMRKHQVLVNKGLENSKEGAALYFKLENAGIEAIRELEIKVDSMRFQIKNERTQRWRGW